MEEGTFIRDRLELRSHVQCAITSDKFGPSKKIRNSFVLTAGDGQEGSVLLVAKVLLLFRLHTQTHCSLTEYVFPKYITCIPPLNDVGKKLGCLSLSCTTTDERDHSAVVGEKLNN